MKRLLMIDDNPMEYKIAKALFKHYGFFLDSVHMINCRDAITEVEKFLQNGDNLPYHILLDLNMPSISGWDFLEFLNSKKNVLLETSIYIFSSSVSLEDRKLSQKYSFVKDFLIKPLTQKMIETLYAQLASSE